jgi:putative two-component system response regulator
MAVADVYDALITKRVYKPAFPHQKAVAIVLDGKGSHFDPLIVDAFIEALPLFQKTAAQFSDD